MPRGCKARERQRQLAFFNDMIRAGTAADPVVVAINSVHDDGYVQILEERLAELKDGELHVIFRMIKDDGEVEDMKTYSGASMQEVSHAIGLFANVRKMVVTDLG